MMPSRQIHLGLGFEVGTGTPVEIPLKHMAITGKSSCAHDFFFFFACASPETHATRWTTKSVGEHPIQTMPFGKNKGVPLADLPDHYLLWILRQTWLKPPLERALVAEYGRRLVDLSDQELQRRIDGAHRGILDDSLFAEHDKRAEATRS
jgi:hypothetical protein